jgi:hypothetical protein
MAETGNILNEVYYWKTQGYSWTFFDFSGYLPVRETKY